MPVNISKFLEEFKSLSLKPPHLDPESANVFFVLKSNETGEKKTFPCHKSELIAAHSVFERLLADVNEMDHGIEIVDASAEAFTEFLEFVHNGRMKFEPCHLEDLLFLSQKYEIPECAEYCVQVCIETMTLQYVCWAYENAIYFGQKILQQTCEKTIRIYAEEIFEFGLHSNCDLSTMARCMKLPLLCSEFDVFRACLSWTKAACARTQGLNPTSIDDLRSPLRELLFKVRFDTIPKETFIENKMLFKQLLKMDELKEIWLLIGGSDTFVSHNFLDKNRRVLQLDWDEDHILPCDRSLNVQTSLDQEIPKLQQIFFRTDRPLLWREFVCGKLSKLDDSSLAEVSMKITIAQHPDKMFFTFDQPKVLFVIEKTLTTESENAVMLPETIIVKPNYKYEIKLEKLEDGRCCTQYVLSRGIISTKDLEIQFDSMPRRQFDCIVTRLHFNQCSFK